MTPPTVGATTAIESSAQALRGRARVLVLEDDSTFRCILVELLEAEGFEVSVCESYAALRDRVRRDRSVVVLADFWGTSHTSLSPHERDEIRELGRQAPTILLTGRAWTRTIDTAELDLMSLLTKPVAIEDMIELLRRCMAIARDTGQ